MKNLNKLLLIVIISVVGISNANAQCNSSFTYVYNGNGSITFTNTSTGTMSYAHWDLGNGYGYLWDTSTTVQYSYYMNGTYLVCLTEGDSATGCTSTFCDSITIFGIYNCNANFTFTNNGSNNISFNNLSLGNYTSVLWNFDDGFTSNSNNPNHTYASTGVYNVCLTVNDSNSGCSDTQCHTVTITGPANCNASFTFVNNGNGTVSFTNTSTGNYTYWEWNFVYGQSWMTNTPTFTYNYNGTYNVCLSITDSTSGCYDTFCDSVVITNFPPCLSNFTFYPDSSNVFDVIVVNNAYGFYLTYFWDFGDGNTSTQQFPQHTYATTGNYYLCLTVDNGNGCVDTYCDSINASGINKTGFTINVVDPNATNINDVNNTITTINSYPNPFKNKVTFELNLTEQANVEVFVTDLLGKQINVITNETMPAGNNKLQWTPANISNGIYLLNIKTNNSLQVKKLVLNR